MAQQPAKQTAKKTRKTAISNITIRDAKPGDKIKDTTAQGLILEVTPKGLKTWFMRLSIRGEQIRYKIGAYPNVTIAGARKIAATHLDIAADGGDPRELLEVKALTRKKGGGAATWTLEQLLDAYCEHKKTILLDRSGEAYKIRRNIENHIYPMIAPTTRAAKITFADCIDALAPLAKSRPKTFKTVQKHFRAVINHLSVADISLRGEVLRIDKGEFARHFEEHTKNLTTQSYTALPVDAAPAFYEFFIERQYKNTMRNALAIEALLFCMLTGARTSEVIGAKPKPSNPDRFIEAMKWHELDFANAVWNIPASRTKNGYDHAIPLNRQALSLLKKVRLKSDKTGLNDPVFFSHLNHDGGLQLSNSALDRQIKNGPAFKYVKREKHKDSVIIERQPTVHGLRDTLGTFLLKAQFAPFYISLQLGHKPAEFNQDQSLETYLSTNTVEERRPLMQVWGDYCATGKTPKNYMPEYMPNVKRILNLI